jgi:hypothetical protein
MRAWALVILLGLTLISADLASGLRTTPRGYPVLDLSRPPVDVAEINYARGMSYHGYSGSSIFYPDGSPFTWYKPEVVNAGRDFQVGPYAFKVLMDWRVQDYEMTPTQVSFWAGV